MYDAGPMSDIPLYLERLGLSKDAAAHDIRRAYARELKRIDQERDGAGFQLLREAYEMAMEWIQWAPAADAIATDAVPALAISPGKLVPQFDPDALAEGVFVRFMADFSVMIRGAATPDLAGCAALLSHALDNAELLNLSARRRFEGLVAQLLAGGWRPGHEILLVAAVEAFEWDGDCRRLYEFGAEGLELSEAIDERNMFDAQPEDDVIGQRRVVARLRTVADPERQELLRDMHHLRALMTRFPTWLALVTRVEHAQRWSELDSQIAGWRRMLAFEREAKRGDEVERGAGSFVLGCFVLFLMAMQILRIVTQDSSTEPPSAVTYQVPISGPGMTVGDVLAEVERMRRKQEDNKALAKSAAFLLEVKEVDDAIAFEPAAALRGTLRVLHQVELDAFGRLARLKVLQASAGSAFDEAAEAAIRAHGHWGAQSPRSFVLVHSR